MTLTEVLRIALAIAMVGVGVLHFTSPRGFEKIVPSYIPGARACVYISGAIEIALGVLLLVPAARPWSAYALMALYVAVFPANVNMAMNDLPFGKHKVPRWAQWARLPLQLVFIAAAWLVR